MATLSYFGCVNNAVGLVRGVHPDDNLYFDAELLEVDAYKQADGTGRGATSIEDLNYPTCVFNTKKGGSQGTVRISCAGPWGEFQPLEYFPVPWLECRVIEWQPIENIMPPTDAYVKIQEAGYTQPFENMTFRWPVDATTPEPLYMFGMGSGFYVIIGSISGKIHTERAEAFEITGRLGWA